MARKFHLSNGGVLLRENVDSLNFEYGGEVEDLVPKNKVWQRG